MKTIRPLLLAAALAALSTVAVGQSFTGPATITQPTTAGNCVKIGPTGANNIVDSGSPCGSGSGTVTEVTGTANQINVATGTTTPVLSLSSTLVAPGSLQITGAATGTSLALGGATIGSNALAVTGTAAFSGTLSTTGAIIAGAAQQIYWSTRTTLQAPSNGALQVGDNSLTNSFTITAGASNLATFNGGVTATGNVIANNSVFSGGPFYTLSGSQNSTGIRAGAASDAILSRAAAATWQLGAADVDTAPVAQTLRSQGALTGGTNNVAGANWTFIASPGKGTGAGGSFIFQTAPAGGSGNTPNTPVTALTIDSTGTSTFASNVFSSANVQAGSSSAILFNARSALRSPSDSVMTLTNNANTDFGRLQFGGTSTSFPALKRAGTSLAVRLADDSAYANIVGKLTTETNYTATPVVETGFLTLYDAAGTAYKVGACLASGC